MIILVKQLSIFLPNKPGILAKLTALLEKNAINIRALTVADTADYGILRVIVNDPDKCNSILKKEDYLVSETEVLALEVEDKPGGLYKVANLMGANDINIEYIYSTLTTKAAVILMRVNAIDKAVKILEENEVKVLKGKEVYGI
ncbi:MAG: ACT domain-containing protein [Candidatus Helarchaeota archaeon]